MNILLLGSGGREHAFAWKLKQSPHCTSLFIAPGNAGTASCGTNLPIGINDFENLKQACITNAIDMVIVGPEEPLVRGIVDFFAADPLTQNIQLIGPDKRAAQLEGSKSFAKGFMRRHKIPTAGYAEFTIDNFEDGLTYLENHSMPVVLKADGLAAGKGVVICQTAHEAIDEFAAMIQSQKFGAASMRVVVEEFLDGIEMSMFALTDGKDFVMLPSAKDYKRIGEGDTGLNTGGMGAISPVPFADEVFVQKVMTQIIEPTIKGLQEEHFNYKGFVFVGLIKVNDEPFVIEYNCRMGDPETEVVIPRLQNDLVQLLQALHNGELSKQTIVQDERAAAAVVAVSGGYPEEHQTGFSITGIDQQTDSLLFHSGTKKLANDDVVTNGGRVLVVTSFGETIADCVQTSKKVLANVHYEGINYRRDIGYEWS
jgi:phosphoribosylamine---glycine ligase